jgi:tellurite resistance protein TerC
MSDLAAWGGLLATLSVLLAVDLLVVRGRRGAMTVRAAALWSAVWVALSLGFAGVLLLAGTRSQAEGFVAGYLVEKSLSLDNVFVFLVVLEAFRVAEERRPQLLTYGILVALVLRGAFIFVGAAALHAVSWIAFPFAALLVWTGWRLWQQRHEHGGEEQLVERFRARLARRGVSVGAAALITLGAVDVIFAVDSVPAILAITTDTFVVYAANAFALLGLRPLFFLVADLVERLYWLKAALAVLLVFIGAKMALGELVGKLPPTASLAGVALIIGAGVVASLLRKRSEDRALAA